MRPGPSGSTLDSQEAPVLGVRDDEVAPWLDLIAHQRREDPVGRALVLDVDPDEHPVRRVHRRLAELIGVHLAEALEAAHLHTLLGELEREVTEGLEAQRNRALLAEDELERRRSDDLGEPRVRAP